MSFSYLKPELDIVRSWQQPFTEIWWLYWPEECQLHTYPHSLWCFSRSKIVIWYPIFDSQYRFKSELTQKNKTKKPHNNQPHTDFEWTHYLKQKHPSRKLPHITENGTEEVKIFINSFSLEYISRYRPWYLLQTLHNSKTTKIIFKTCLKGEFPQRQKLFNS